jgi:hypothetical protein
VKKDLETKSIGLVKEMSKLPGARKANLPVFIAVRIDSQSQLAGGKNAQNRSPHVSFSFYPICKADSAFIA